MTKLTLKAILNSTLITILLTGHISECFKAANVNLLQVFESHPFHKKYDEYLNRFLKSSKPEMLDIKRKAAKDLELQLSMEVKKSHDTYLSKRATLNKEIDKLKAFSQGSLSQSLINIGNKKKQNDLEFAKTLLALKKIYTDKLDNLLKPEFYSHSESQIIWNKILNEIRSELEVIRVKNNIDVVIQSNPKMYSHGHFFNELNQKISDLSTELSWLALNETNVAESMFEYLANTIKTDQFLKLLPAPIDITSQLLQRMENINE